MSSGDLYEKIVDRTTLHKNGLVYYSNQTTACFSFLPFGEDPSLETFVIRLNTGGRQEKTKYLIK